MEKVFPKPKSYFSSSFCKMSVAFLSFVQHYVQFIVRELPSILKCMSSGNSLLVFLSSACFNMQLAFFSIKLRVYGENIICISVTIIFSQLFLSSIRCTIDRSLLIIKLSRVDAVDAPYFVSTLAGRGVRIPCSNGGFLVVREQGAGHQEQLHRSPGLHSQSSEQRGNSRRPFSRTFLQN